MPGKSDKASFLEARPVALSASRMWIMLALIVAAGAFFRLYDLGLSAFRADTILLYSLAQRKVPPADVFAKWFEVSGAAGQMPMPAWIMQIFLAAIGWQVTPFTVRLPFALVGIVTIPIAFWSGCRFGGRLFGILFAALVALNSFHIAVSREAYFYATAFLGYFLLSGVVWDLAETFQAGQRIRGMQIARLGIGLFFSAYSQITGLVVCAAVGLILFANLLKAQRNTKTFGVNLAALALTYAVILAPLVFVSWGLRPLLQQIGANVEYGKKMMAVAGGSLAGGLTDGLLQFGWGWTLWGWTVMVVSLGGGSLVLIQRKDSRIAWIWGGAIIMVALFAAARSAAGAMYEARYFSGLLPFYLCLAATALELPFRLRVTNRYATTVSWVGRTGSLAAIVWLAYPAYLQTQLTGKPTPYWDIVQWTDSHLPKGTLVLVDRWFEPWNELQSHPSTNVHFTFTVPNEPLETFLKVRWRDTAKAFFEKFPDAVLLEIAKEYYEVPGVGPWEWPRTYFARHHAITNEAGLKLRRLGLVNRGDFFAVTTNRLIVEFFYNTRDDLVQKWNREGRTLACLCGQDWGYVKPWQQTGDFRDWRVLRHKASLDIYNLTEKSLPARISILGVAVGNSKRIVASTGATHNFMYGKLDTWTITIPEVTPGHTEIVLLDAAGPSSESALWVSDLRIDLLPPVPADEQAKDAQNEKQQP